MRIKQDSESSLIQFEVGKKSISDENLEGSYDISLMKMKKSFVESIKQIC